MSFYPSNAKYEKSGGLSKGGRCFAGFTLIEILVAISVFAVVISIVLGALTFFFSRIDAIREGLTIYEDSRVCLDRISTDLKAVYVSVPPAYKPPGLDDDPDPYRFFCETSHGGDSRLAFIAFSHLPLDKGLPAKAGSVMYYLHETENDGRVLMRRDTVLKTDEGEELFRDRSDMGLDPILCRNVKSFKILCFDRDGGEYDSWDSDSADSSQTTPVAVLVRLELEGAGTNYQFDTMVAIPVIREKAADAL